MSWSCFQLGRFEFRGNSQVEESQGFMAIPQVEVWVPIQGSVGPGDEVGYPGEWVPEGGVGDGATEGDGALSAARGFPAIPVVCATPVWWANYQV